MSRPRLSGEQLAVDTTDRILRVTTDPGFTSDNPDGCPYRAVVLSGVAGPYVFGMPPAARTLPDDRWPGFIGNRDDLAAWRREVPIGTLRLRVYAGSLFEPWVPGQEGPFIEWGSDDLGQNPSGVPRINEVTFTVTDPVPPPPNDARLAEGYFHASTIGQAAMKTWARSSPGEFQKWKQGDRDPAHYATRFGKFLAHLGRAAG